MRYFLTLQAVYICIYIIYLYHWDLKPELHILILTLSTRCISLVQTVNSYDANSIFILFWVSNSLFNYFQSRIKKGQIISKTQYELRVERPLIHNI